MTTRHRKKLPPNCTLDRGKYVVWRKQVDGVSQRFPMGKLSDGMEQIWQNYLEFMKATSNKPKPNTLRWLSGLFFESRAFKKLSKHTRGGHERGSRVLDQPMTEPDNLGQVRLKYVTKPLINQIIDRRLTELQDKGMKGTGVVNLEISFLKTMLSWGCNHVNDLEITNSPLIGLKAQKVEGRTRYVTDEEYRIQYNYASERMQCVYELAYLCACRSVEIRNLKESDIQGDRLYLARRKGSKHNYVEISPRLRKALTTAMKLRPTPKISRIGEDRHIFTKRTGGMMTRNILTGEQTRIKKRMEKAGHGDVFWQLHLLKHKGMTDAQDKDVAGLSESTKRIYDHGVPTNKPVR
jgi:integrase